MGSFVFCFSWCFAGLVLWCGFEGGVLKLVYYSYSREDIERARSESGFKGEVEVVKLKDLNY